MPHQHKDFSLDPQHKHKTLCMATWVPVAQSTVVGEEGGSLGLAGCCPQSGSVKDDLKGGNGRGAVRQPESSSDLRVRAPHIQKVCCVKLSNEARVNISR